MSYIAFDARLDLIPESPGVYLMKDATGSVIYVGKALNLRNRLRNYFTENPKGSAKVLAMISHIADFEFVICNTETEALLLECNLIKKHRPHYNILMMDDKEYPYIKITDEAYPRVVKAMRIGDDVNSGAKYYGPYMHGVLNNALDTLKDLFPVRNCNLRLPEDMGKKRPCLNYHIGKCSAPCYGLISQEEYLEKVNAIRMFLEGKYDGITKQLNDEMDKAAGALQFENAAKYRDKLAALKKLTQKQIITSIGGKDLDVIGMAHNQAEICVQKLEIRQGRIVGNATFFSDSDEDNHTEALQDMLLMHYSGIAYIPPDILIPFELPSVDAFAQAVGSIRGAKVNVRIPVRGTGRELGELAQKNAQQVLRRRALMAGTVAFAAKESLASLSELLCGDADRLVRLEAFDISNYGSDDIAASMVVFVDGKPHRAGYRLFKIKLQDKQDDYMAMREALQRRFARAGDDAFAAMPQLLLVDGGAGHVSTALGVLAETGINDIHVLGMVKDNKHRTRGLAFPDGSVMELSGARANDVEPDTSLSYEDRRSLLRLVSAIQDEAHRFAVKYSGKLANKRQIKFSLESINGVGPARRKALLTQFGSLRAIADASIDDMEKVKGITRDVAESVFIHFHGKRGETK